MSNPREEELFRQLQAREEELKRANARIALLEQKIDSLVKRIFGRKSEKLDPKQLELLLQLRKEVEELGKAEASVEAEATNLSKDASRPNKKARRNEPRWPDDLPVEEEIVDPEPVKALPQAWRYIGSEVSEQLDYQPARFFRRRLIRRKYVQRNEQDGVPVIAPLPEKLQDRCIAAPGLIAQMIVSKYCDHLPLYRQQLIYQSRHGVYLPRQSMARWMGLAAEWLRPIYQQIRTGVMAGGYIQVDETPIRYLVPGHGRSRQGYLWTSSNPRGDDVFNWHTSRAAACRITSSPLTLAALCSATATRHTAPLHKAGIGELPSQDAGLMSGASSMRRLNRLRVMPDGSSCKSRTSTKSKLGCGSVESAPHSALLHAHTRALQSSGASITL